MVISDLGLDTLQSGPAIGLVTAVAVIRLARLKYYMPQSMTKQAPLATFRLTLSRDCSQRCFRGITLVHALCTQLSYTSTFMCAP